MFKQAVEMWDTLRLGVRESRQHDITANRLGCCFRSTFSVQLYNTRSFVPLRLCSPAGIVCQPCHFDFHRVTEMFLSVSRNKFCPRQEGKIRYKETKGSSGGKRGAD